MKKFISDIIKFRNYTIFSARAELKSEVADSYLSWLWWILDPLLYMLVYAFIAIIVFRSNIQYFPVFVFIGLNSWQFFSKTFKSSIKLVSKKKSIVTKVYVPKFQFVFEKMGVYGFKMLVSYVLTIIFMIIYQVPVTVHMLWVIPLLLELMIITFAFSTIFLHFGVFVEDLQNIITVVLQLLFYLSGIFYSIEERVPQPFNDILVKCNPVALVITDLRRVLLNGAEPHYFALLVWLAVCLLISVIGVKIIYKYENSYVKVI